MTEIICLDARMWGIKHTGIGRYVENLIDNFPHQAVSKLVLIISPEQLNEPKLSKFIKHVAYSHPYSLFSQIEIPLLLAHIRPSLFHVPHFTVPVLWQGKMAVTIHDLIKHISKGRETTTRSPLLYWIKYLGYRFIIREAVYRSQKIIVPAQYWKTELLKKYHIPSEKIIVTYEGVNTELFSDNANISVAVPFSNPFVIYTGNLYPHKNIPTLLRAIKNLNGAVKLIIVSSRSIFAKRLEKMMEELDINPFVRLLGNVNDEDLAGLYKKSLAFVFPSLIEGFGLTGLEAMAAGTPVIAAKASCLPEIYGQAALYFEPLDSADLVQKITCVLDNPDLRTDMISRGKNQIKKYSWAKMAKETWQTYLQILH